MVHASREGDWWFLEVDGIAGGYSQARRLDQVESAVRDLLALLLEIPPDSFDIDVLVQWPEELQAASERAIAAQRRAEHARDVARAEQLRASELAAKAGLTVRDVAALLELSPQRVSQLRIAEARGAYRTSQEVDPDAG
jgi:hypothetical protein